MRYLILFVLLSTGCIDELPSPEEFAETKQQEEQLIEEAQAAVEDAGSMAEVPTDSGTLEVLADSGTSEAQADAGTPEIEVDAGTPEAQVDAGA